MLLQTFSLIFHEKKKKEKLLLKLKSICNTGRHHRNLHLKIQFHALVATTNCKKKEKKKVRVASISAHICIDANLVESPCY